MGKPSANAVAELPRKKGALGFEEHYIEALGSRWAAIKNAFLNSPLRVLRVNGFADAATSHHAVKMGQQLAFAPNCHALQRNTESEDSPYLPVRDAAGLLTFYQMDPASVLAAQLVDSPEGSRVLDLCAAPGGKSLVLAERFASTGQLVLNDRSPLRRKRLLQVLKDYVPREVRSCIVVKNHDGRMWGKHEPNAYDAILLDSPCSSERHVLNDPEALSQWSIGRIHRLYKEQVSLARSALHALRPGGLLVYCTCALAQQENDGVIAELLNSKSVCAQPLETRLPIGEPTSYGWQILPDITGFGPLYVARLIKT